MKLLLGDALEQMKGLADNSVDLVCTDPPYGIGFMGKAWDTFEPHYVASRNAKDGKASLERRKANGFEPKDIGSPTEYASPAAIAGQYDYSLKGRKGFADFMYKTAVELIRVLKPGAFLFMTMTPRQDCLARVQLALEDAGFNIGFTPIYWTFASGFPKAANTQKQLEKRGHERAQEFDGAYGGFQPKPAVEVIIVAMKPLSEKTFVDQALKNGKGITWLDDCRVPTDPTTAKGYRANAESHTIQEKSIWNTKKSKLSQDYIKDGRFPANLLVSDDVLNDGVERVSKYGTQTAGNKEYMGHNSGPSSNKYTGDTGSYSRYFDLDAFANKLAKAYNIDICEANLTAITASEDLPTGLPTEPASTPSVQPNAQLNSDLVSPSPDAASAGENVISIATATAQKSARTKRGTATSDATSTTSENASITPIMPSELTHTLRWLANCAATQPELCNAIIQTWQSQEKSSGSVSPVTIKQMLQATDHALQWPNFESLPESVRKVFPFLVCPKASKGEKNQGLEGREKKDKPTLSKYTAPSEGRTASKSGSPQQNFHPTVKPLKLMSYLITLGSRPGDVVLDPFLGSGTTAIAARRLGRDCIGIEREPDYMAIAKARIAATPPPLPTLFETKGGAHDPAPTPQETP